MRSGGEGDFSLFALRADSTSRFVLLHTACKHFHPFAFLAGLLIWQHTYISDRVACANGYARKEQTDL
jgi:hypothetical protein